MIPLSEYFHTNKHGRHPNRWRKQSIRTFKYVFTASDKDIFVELTKYNRVPIHHALFEVTRVWASFFQESSCFDILHSWVLSNLPMDSRLLKAWHASLSCEDIENRDAELGKFWATSVPALGKMLRWVQANCIDLSADITNEWALMTIFLFYFTLT